MSWMRARRFWADVSVAEVPGGHEVRLDARPLRTPYKSPLVLASRPLAEAVAEEWRAQGEHILPNRMPLTRAVNSAVDKVATQRDAVAAMLVEYGASDLLCYRAEAPEGLVARQDAAWDPWLDWAGSTLGAALIRVVGMVPVDQPPRSLARLRAAVDAHDDVEMTALHDLVTLSGSLVLGLAVSRGALAPEAAWDASRIDETWQQEQWGIDAEAAEAAAARRQALLDAARLLRLARGETA